jgi:hypothetical protein
MADILVVFENHHKSGSRNGGTGSLPCRFSTLPRTVGVSVRLITQRLYFAPLKYCHCHLIHPAGKIGTSLGHNGKKDSINKTPSHKLAESWGRSKVKRRYSAFEKYLAEDLVGSTRAKRRTGMGWEFSDRDSA